jgi:hypothetical protein
MVEIVLMKRIYCKSIIFIILILSAVLLVPGCASSNKNPYQAKKKASHIDTSQLGRNKYFFSNKYQKKLYKFKKK